MGNDFGRRRVREGRRAERQVLVSSGVCGSRERRESGREGRFEGDERAAIGEGRWWMLMAGLGVGSPRVVRMWGGGCCGGSCLVVEPKEENREIKDCNFGFKILTIDCNFCILIVICDEISNSNSSIYRGRFIYIAISFN